MSQPDPGAIFAEFDVDGDKQVCSSVRLVAFHLVYACFYTMNIVWVRLNVSGRLTEMS